MSESSSHEGPPISLNARLRTVARNAVSGYITLFLGALVGFVVTPILLHSLGTVAYGTWSLVLAASGYLSLLELGVGLASITRIAANEPEGVGAISRIASSSLVLFSGVALAATLLAAVGSIFLPRLFSVPHHLVGEARVAFFLGGLAQALASLTGAFSAFLLGTGRMYLVNFSGAAVAAAVSLGQAGLALLGAGIAQLAIVQVIGAVLTLTVFRFQVRRSLPSLAMSLRGGDREERRALLSLGWRNALISIASIFAFGSDLVLVGLLLSPKAAAAYAIGLRGYTFVQRLSAGATNAVGPTHAYAAASASNARRFDLFCAALAVALIFAIVLGLTVAVYAHALLELWLGRFPSGAVLVVTILCVVLILQTPGSNAATLLISSQRSDIAMPIIVLSAGLNVLASIVATIKLGVPGPAVGSLIAVAVFDAIYFPRRACAVLGQPFRLLVTRVVRPLLVPAAVLAGLLAMGRVLVPKGPFVLLICAAAAVVYGVVVWFNPGLRKLVHELRQSNQPAQRDVVAP